MARNVLVTGSSGPFGVALAGALCSHPLAARVIGIDQELPPAGGRPKFKHYPADVRDGIYLRHILEAEEVDIVFHPVSLTETHPERGRAQSHHIVGTLAAVEAANKASRVQKLVILSSASAYGARRSNQLYLKEEAPLRATVIQQGFWPRRMEEEIAKLQHELRPDLQLSILRVCNIASPSGSIIGPAAIIPALPFRLSPLFKDCALQFLPEQELIRALLRVLETPDFRGGFNVAPDDHVSLKALCGKIKGPHLRLPFLLFRPVVWLAGRIRRSPDIAQSAAPYLAYPVVADNGKIKRALGVCFETASQAAFLSASTPSRQSSAHS